MPDREKVMRGLKCHSTHGYEMCFDCPYYTNPDDFIYKGDDDLEGVCCEEKLASDALALLKEQEARVLSWEEVKKSGSAYRYVEIYSPQVRRLVLIYCIVRQSETIPELYYLLEDSGVSWCRTETEYNRDCWQGTVSGWRCWTARPTEEQRKAAWDG